jgi:response regulator of citrate/malate metabolism
MVKGKLTEEVLMETINLLRKNDVSKRATARESGITRASVRKRLKVAIEMGMVEPE